MQNRYRCLPPPANATVLPSRSVGDMSIQGTNVLCIQCHIQIVQCALRLQWVQLCINSGLMGKLLTRGGAEKIWSKVKGEQGEKANRRGLFLPGFKAALLYVALQTVQSPQVVFQKAHECKKPSAVPRVSSCARVPESSSSPPPDRAASVGMNRSDVENLSVNKRSFYRAKVKALSHGD